jgi:hypothetical protein
MPSTFGALMDFKRKKSCLAWSLGFAFFRAGPGSSSASGGSAAFGRMLFIGLFVFPQVAFLVLQAASAPARFVPPGQLRIIRFSAGTKEFRYFT